jgi:hypothetical protein
MKNRSFITFSLAAVIVATGVISLQSCTKKLDSAYLNPNNPVESSLEAVLPNTINQMTSTAAPPAGGGGGSYGPAAESVLMARYIQYWGEVASGNANATYDLMGGVYGTTSDNTGLVWAMHYYGIGPNAKYIISRGIEQEKWDYVGVAHAIFAFSWLTLTEEYGDAVILRQAFDGGRDAFDYDPQQLVYDSVRVICDNAIRYLSRTDGKVSPTELAKGDAYFLGGDVNKWKKFVYAIKARSFAHLSNKSFYATQGYADSVVKYCDLSITSNADNAMQKWAGGNFSGTNNYYGPYRGNIGSIRQTAFIADLLSGANTQSPFTGIQDPRAPYLITENENGKYRGITPGQGPSGLVSADQPKNFWRAPFASTAATVDSGRYIFNNLAPFPVITAADVAFMKAEALYRKGAAFKPQALAAYRKGIDLSFEMLRTTYDSRVWQSLKITNASEDTYKNNPAVTPTDPANLTLSHIMLQKYIALYGYGFNETWTDMRRFHYTDQENGKQVYAGFTLPATFHVNNLGKPAYRARPRYNSEYLYNIPSLQKVGALAQDYHTKEQWFSQP